MGGEGRQVMVGAGLLSQWSIERVAVAVGWAGAAMTQGPPLPLTSALGMISLHVLPLRVSEVIC